MCKIRHSVLVLTLACLMLSGIGMRAPKAEAAGPPPVVIFDTTMGRFIVMLYPKEAPITVKNFMRYVDEGFYNDTLIHRVVRTDDFDLSGTNSQKEIPYDIIQGGGFEADMHLKDTYAPIVSEASKGLLNKKGTIAMARGAHADSATAQFFINVEDNIFFDFKMTADTKVKDKFNTRQGYCAFGKVIRGMDVVEKISQVKTGKKGRYDSVPMTPIFIKRAYRPQ